MHIVRTSTSEENKETTTGIVRQMHVKRMMPLMDDYSLEELQFFMDRAIDQEEYELCAQLKALIEMRYRFSVA
ncbi:MAG TPA: hypothetical protein VF145_06310 [Chitinophagaceae bacterium]